MKVSGFTVDIIPFPFLVCDNNTVLIITEIIRLVCNNDNYRNVSMNTFN